MEKGTRRGDKNRIAKSDKILKIFLRKKQISPADITFFRIDNPTLFSDNHIVISYTDNRGDLSCERRKRAPENGVF